LSSDWKKLERDGKVAILVSPGFGAGWSTWASPEQREQAMFDSRLVEVILNNETVSKDQVEEWFGGDAPYDGGVDQLIVEWLPKGTAFTIEEYDGSESLRLIEYLAYTA